MTERNKNNNQQKHQIKSIKNQYNIQSSNNTDLKSIPYLYGMTLEEYKEGAEIHSKCFDQIKMIITI
ncbi:hypothetical protein [Flavobacterium notoginsengisoli]|uniref:hypothetical protein n=1 Tax=Flavobacterium notoginsengisoli TaxID=1478199 RepID=UPI00362C6362